MIVKDLIDELSRHHPSTRVRIVTYKPAPGIFNHFENIGEVYGGDEYTECDAFVPFSEREVYILGSVTRATAR